MKNANKKVFFLYPSGERLTGQELASIYIIKLLSQKGWCFRVLKLPVLNRDTSCKIKSYLEFIISCLIVWLKIFKLFFCKSPLVYLNLGQSCNTIIREGLPIIFISKLKTTSRLVISLHGSWFMFWEKQSLLSKLFILVLKNADIVTVLGRLHEKKLLELDIPSNKIRLVNNTCIIPQNVQKTTHLKRVDQKITILFLSNLIPAKGYREYLEALELLSKSSINRKVEAVICGEITSAGFSKSFSIEKKFIEEIIKKINCSEDVNITWEKGAYGKKKYALLKSADIFVFPSKIEGQPIVLLEAMACSCAIIASCVGEIPDTVKDAGKILKGFSKEEIFAEIFELINDDNKRRNLAKRAVIRFESHFNSEIYARSWNKIFLELWNRQQVQ